MSHPVYPLALVSIPIPSSPSLSWRTLTLTGAKLNIIQRTNQVLRVVCFTLPVLLLLRTLTYSWSLSLS
jgi:hypothetical protein